MTDFEPITKNVTGLQFSIMSPEEIRNNSVVEVTKHETYDKDVPVIKGLFDNRMGTTDMGKVCNTCGLDNMGCPGHFGHIELARPIYNYHFMDITIKILKCICFRCGKLRVNKELPIISELLTKSNKTRWNTIYELSSKITRCGQETEDGCGCMQPHRYKLDGVAGIQTIWKDLNDQSTDKQMLKAEYVKSLFEKISDEDCNLLGFSPIWCRPEWLICTALPVPPPTVRPSVKQGNSQRMDDDLTHKLAEIVKYNNTLKKKIETFARQEIIDDWYNMVVYHVITFIDNEQPGISPSTHRSGRPLKAIRQRLKGKEGRLRSNLMGKRVDFSARSVITPDPNIDLDQLGVPFKIALNLTFPEIVNSFNRDELQGYISNGPNKWPGAKSIIKKDGSRFAITETNKGNHKLEYGDKVNRHIVDNDWVLFNRQPSLHKMSMMGHRVKVMKGDTFRLNVSVTPPYNADFDGDEMNMHVPQSIHSMSELINICSVNSQIISPRENKPIITIVQDTLLGMYKLTHSEIIQFNEGSSINYAANTNIYEVSDKTTTHKCVDSCLYTKKQLINIISDLSTFNGTIPKSDNSFELNGINTPLWSGKSILSYILPENINLEMVNGSYDNLSSTDDNTKTGLLSKNNDKVNIVKIVNGIIKQGTFDKGLFTKTSKGLIHTIFNDLGPERTNHFINDLQKIITHVLLIEGFSVGISDMIADNETNEKIKNIISERKVQIEEIAQEFHLNIFEGIPGQSNKDYFESKVNSILNKTINDTGRIALSNLDPKNRATFMVNSGSKGKLTNIAQMIACLGQQNIDGKRIPYGFDGRTLPHYHKYDDSSEARGFVENSFISGQTPQEFFFHAMGGREGLIDTAVKTSQTGYVQRKLVKAMEDLMVGYDYSVRTSSGSIIQFVYGNDGMDACHVESQSIYLTKLPYEKLMDKFYFDENTNWAKYYNKPAAEKAKALGQSKLDDIFLKLLSYREYLISDIFNGNIQNNINYPVHIQRIVENTVKKNKKSNILPIDIDKGNQKLINSLYIRDDFKNNKIFEILIHVHLNPKVLISEYQITREEYKIITKIIRDKYHSAKISPGEMVGALAAQSIGEPATQMTLNTFHFAGVSAKSNVTRGIPRLKELIHVSKNIKSPSTIIYLNDDFNDKTKIAYAKNQLEYTMLKDLILKSSIYYDPRNRTGETDIKEDEELLSIYKEFELLSDSSEDNISPWIIRFVFDHEAMMDKGVIMEDIHMKLLDYDPERIIFIYADDNSKNLIGRISIKIDAEKGEINGIQDQSDIISTIKNINEDIINNIVIKGIPNISNIIVSDISASKINDEKIQLQGKKEHDIENVTRQVLVTDGVNLLEIMNNDFVNPNKTLSNDIIEIVNVLGIEGARSVLIDEITDVVDHAGEYINIRHIELLCDTMTCKGSLTSVNRQGINRGDVGPLAKSSFEDTTDQLIKAGIFSEKDNLSGVSSNIMMGQTIKSGTGLCNILLDEEIMSKNSMDMEDEYEETITDIDTLMTIEEEGECGTDNFKFSFE
jgi:DNA-directed RNA polymerase II subunit RPB1